MASSQCSSCGLSKNNCQCFEQIKLIPSSCFYSYFLFTLCSFIPLFFIMIVQTNAVSCYLELFANSVTVSNANVSTANWRIGLAVRSPITNCKISIRTIKSRLLHGDEVISMETNSFAKFVKVGDETNVVFKKVVMPRVTSDDVIWKFGVEIIFKVKKESVFGDGFITVACPDIPVSFTTDPAGNMKGSLLGNMRLCDYQFRLELDDSD